ncbi:MAG: DUF5696 domain-containing protein [Defluviitaleaceae bacterium]|nr:DUF5696 domain-containing protein [Defluviitaleaceae bacterium]
MQPMRKLIATMAFGLILCAALALPIFPALTAYAADLGDFDLMAQNENFELFADPSTAMFYVRDRGTGATFHSRPVDFEADEVAMGINRMLMSSLISVRTLDHHHVERIFAASTESVNRGNFEFRPIANGFEADFLFEDQGVSVLVRILLTPEGFRAEIPIEGIVERGPHILTQIQLLPFFGAGQAGEDGYVFLPDGSGALIEFDAVFSLPHELIRPIYGADAAMATTMMPNNDEIWRLPVFGIRRGDTAFLAVIDEGAAVTTLSTRVGGDTSQYFRVMPNLIYRARHTMVLFENTGDERPLLQPSPRRLRQGLAIDYLLLSGEDVDYSAMAVAYRNYLLERGMLTARDTTPFVDLTLIGGIRVNRNFLGIPYETLQPLTTFAQAGNIVDYLQSRGVDNMHVNLTGFNQGGLGQLFNNRVRPERQLGGSRGLNALSARANGDDGVGLTYAGELLNVQRSGNGFSPSRHGARNISGGIANQFHFDIISRLRDYSRTPRMILSPRLLVDRARTFMNSLGNFNLSAVMLTGLGSAIHGDYGNNNFTTRDESEIYWRQTMAAATDAGLSFVADGGNAYVLPFADRIVGIPMGSSGFRMTTREIPFYQLVIHGFIPYSGIPTNMAESQQQGFLRMIEYGAWPSFMVFYAQSSAVRGAEQFRILSGNYSAWGYEMERDFRTMQNFYAATAGTPMVRHQRIMPRVYAVTYENGAVVIVNYRDEDVIPLGFESLTDYVPARGYRMIAGNENGVR